MQLGIDLDINENGSNANIFSDVQKSFTGWYTGSGYDSNGYPTQNGMQCQCLLYGCPPGTYTVQFDGTAIITNWGRPLTNIVKSGATTTAQLVLGNGNWANLTISGLNPADPFKNFHLWQPGANPTSPPFSEIYVNWLKPFAVYRSIDWCGVNISNADLANPSIGPALLTSPVTWANRVQPSGWDQTSRGVAWENILALALQTKMRPWLNVPYMADDEYAQNLAQLIKTTLLPAGIIPIIEVANEVWNSGFGQWKQNYTAANSPVNYAVDGNIVNGIFVPTAPGQAPVTNANTRANRLYAQRARHLANVMRDVLGDGNMQMVLGGQHMNPQVATDELQFLAAAYGDVAQVFQYLAVAPYFPLNQPAAGMTLQQIHDAAVADLASNCGPMLAAHKKLADQYGLLLAGYEGGQSYYPWTPGNQLGNPASDGKLPWPATDLPVALQTDPLMLDLYQRWLATCQQSGVALQMHCSSIRPWITGGMFALQQDPYDAPGPKWTALSQFAQSPVPAPGTPTKLAPGLYQV